MKPWIVLGLLSAVFAGLVGVVGKRGLDQVDPTLGTAVRAVIMAAALALAALALGKMQGVTSIPRGALLWIALSGACGAASWLAYFWALRFGPAGPVAALDRLSVVFALLFAALFLRERLTSFGLLGGALIVAGAILIAWKR
jgi:bacterial/archaeal transporter family protein